tara:strand:+ start:85 stop:312 length:228 start_codon:yes stop_codon:yes gene_type:complete
MKVRIDYNPKTGKFHTDRHPRAAVTKPYIKLFPTINLTLALEFREYAYFTLNTLVTPLKISEINKEFKLFLKRNL